MPPQDVLEALCNLGYASGCAWVPTERAWDAVRFSVAAPADAETAARVLQLVYVCERRHRPVKHGELHFDLRSAAWLLRHEDSRVQKMAECFVESYLKKKA